MTVKTTGNDLENDRKRPRKWVILLEVEEWIPRKFPDFPRIFLDFPCKFRNISIKILIFASFFIFNRIIYKVWKKKIS